MSDNARLDALAAVKRVAAVSVFGWMLVILVASAAVEIVRFETVVGSFQPSHILVLALLPFVAFKDPIFRRLVIVMIGFAAIFALLSVPSIAVFADSARIFPVLQLGMHALTLVVTFGIARRLDRTQLVTVVSVLTLLLLVASVIHLALSPEFAPGQVARLFGIPRPQLWFQEPTWLAFALALLCSAALQLRVRWASIALFLTVFVMWTRSATIITFSSVAVMFRPFHRPGVARVVRSAIVALLAAAPVVGLVAVLWIINSATLPVEPSSNSIVTRIWDTWSVAQSNAAQFWPWGASVVDVYDIDRSREIPLTSNVLPFELLWKYGLPGVGMLLLISALFVTLPAYVGSRRLTVTLLSPGGIALALVPVASIFSNAVGRPFTWLFAGLTLAAMLATSSAGTDAREDESP